DLRRPGLRPPLPRPRVRGRSGVAPRPAERYDALAMTTSRGMVPADLPRIRFVSDAQVSPDGRVVAFVVTTLSEERDEYLSQIWLVDGAGGEPRRFPPGPPRAT